MFEAVKKIYAQDLFSESSTAKERLGTIRELEDGRVFRYCQAGSGGAAQGKLYQSAVPAANHSNCSVAVAAAVGAKRISVTLGATAATANQYKDGFLFVNDVDGEGAIYKIKGHAAIDSAGTGWFNLYDPIRVALTTSSQVTLVTPWAGLIIHPSPPTAALQGVAPIAVTANYYAWFQIKGLCAVLGDNTTGTLAIASSVVASKDVDGAVSDASPVLSEGTPNTMTLKNEPRIGVVYEVAADTEYYMVNLDIK